MHIKIPGHRKFFDSVATISISNPNWFWKWQILVCSGQELHFCHATTAVNWVVDTWDTAHGLYGYATFSTVPIDSAILILATSNDVCACLAVYFDSLKLFRKLAVTDNHYFQSYKREKMFQTPTQSQRRYHGNAFSHWWAGRELTSCDQPVSYCSINASCPAPEHELIAARHPQKLLRPWTKWWAPINPSERLQTTRLKCSTAQKSRPKTEPICLVGY